MFSFNHVCTWAQCLNVDKRISCYIDLLVTRLAVSCLSPLVSKIILQLVSKRSQLHVNVGNVFKLFLEFEMFYNGLFASTIELFMKQIIFLVLDAPYSTTSFCICWAYDSNMPYTG